MGITHYAQTPLFLVKQVNFYTLLTVGSSVAAGQWTARHMHGANSCPSFRTKHTQCLT